MVNYRTAHTLEENCGKLKVCETQWKTVDIARSCRDTDRTEAYLKNCGIEITLNKLCLSIVLS